MSPTTIGFPQTRVIVYRLHIATSAEEERFTVRLRPPAYGNGTVAFGGFAVPASPILLLGRPELHGPGHIVSFRKGSADGVAGTPESPCAHGYQRALRTRVRVAVPPFSQTTIVVRYRTGRSAPFEHTDYRLQFVVVGFSGGSLFRQEVVQLPRPRVVGARAVRIGIRVRPRASRRGSPVVISGRTRPSLARAPLLLQLATFRGIGIDSVAYGRPQTFARTRTDRSGRFRFAWTPSVVGHFLLIATAPRSTPRYVASRSDCTLSLSLSN